MDELEPHKRLLAVDPSLSCSGWALFSVASEGLLAVGNLRAPPPDRSLAERLAEIQSQVTQLFDRFELGTGDLLICEAPTTMRDPRAVILVEQVRGIFETLARVRGLRVPGRINPRTVQYELLGLRGAQLSRELVKQSAVTVVARLYTTELTRLGFAADEANLKRYQDIVDAMLVGRVALAWIRSAAAAAVALDTFFEQELLQRAGRRRFKLKAVS